MPNPALLMNNLGVSPDVSGLIKCIHSPKLFIRLRPDQSGLRRIRRFHSRSKLRGIKAEAN
jgi:hypothetical protein